MAAIGVGHGSQQASSGNFEPEDLTPSFNDDEDERYTRSMMEAWVQARVGDEEASYGHTGTFTHLQVCEAERRSWRLFASNTPMAAA